MTYEKMADEKGRPMHKSTGNAIWFDEAVEGVGAEPMRWLFTGEGGVRLRRRFGRYSIHAEHPGFIGDGKRRVDDLELTLCRARLQHDSAGLLGGGLGPVAGQIGRAHV